PEHPHERSRHRRVHEGLRIEELAAAAPLQEDALGPGRILAAHAVEISLLVPQVEVVGEARGHRVVRRAVAPEPPVGSGRQVEEEGGADEEADDDAQDHPRAAVAHGRPGGSGPTFRRTSAKVPSAAAGCRDRSWRTYRYVS